MSSVRAERERQVSALPRRVAHVAHALLVAQRAHNSTVTAAEITIYDGESFSVQQTARALVEASRKGLAVYTGTYWLATGYCKNLESALEARYLRDACEFHGHDWQRLDANILVCAVCDAEKDG